MSAVIKSEIDRRTKKEVFFAEGVVEFVKLDKFPEMKTSYIKVAGQPDKKIESTHKASILLKEKGASREDAGQWIGLGEVKLHPEHENLQVKAAVGDAPERWVTIERGVEVALDLKVSEWQGKTYYNSSKGKISVLSVDGVQQAPASNKPAGNGQAAGKGTWKKDNSGMEAGHAVNGALYLQRNGVSGSAVDLAKLVHEATVQMKTEVALQRGVDVSDYDTGASVGHAVLNACRDAKGEVTVASLIEAAKPILAVSDEVLAVIKGANSEAKAPAKTEAKPKADKPASTPKDPEPTPSAAMDFDDDVPFAPVGLQYARHAISALYA